MKQSISRKLLIGLIIFTIILATCICAFSSYYLRKTTIEDYEYVGEAMTGTIAERLDGDKIYEYLSTGVPDEYYEDVLEEINVADDKFDSLYVYVAVPTDDAVLYLWSNGFSGEETIGFTTEYAPGGREWMQGRLNGTESEILKFADDPEFGRVATAASPIYDSNGDPVALVLVDFSVQDINDTIRDMIIRVVIVVLLLMIIYILIYYYYVQKKVVVPVKKLTSAAKDLTENLDKDHVYKSDIHTKDELEDLSKAFEKMDVELREYINENMRITAETERISAELDMASSIQDSQLPSKFPAFPEHSEFDIFASMTPAKEVGGDFYDFFMVDDDHIAMVMADVSGKGVPAALFMMIAKLLIKSRIQMGDSPAEALHSVNQQLLENNEANQFVTVWLALVELSTGKGVATNAGHEHPTIRRAGGMYELVEYRHSPPVATMKKTKFRDHEFELKPGDSLFVYTDGVPEATNAQNELFGTDRMLWSLNRETDADPETILKYVKEGIDLFVDGAEQFDDITMMCFKYYGKTSDDREE